MRSDRALRGPRGTARSHAASGRCEAAPGSLEGKAAPTVRIERPHRGEGSSEAARSSALLERSSLLPKDSRRASESPVRSCAPGARILPRSRTASAAMKGNRPCPRASPPPGRVARIGPRQSKKASGGPVIARRYPLAQTAEAHAFLESHRAHGSLVIDVIATSSPRRPAARSPRSRVEEQAPNGHAGP